MGCCGGSSVMLSMRRVRRHRMPTAHGRVTRAPGSTSNEQPRARGAAELRHAPPDRAVRATTLLMSRLEECVSMHGVARASGLSLRTLYRTIRNVHGTSPAAMRRQARLELARADLQSAGLATTVTSVALHWGFTHLGRFSRDYLRAFDELPSRTLQRARPDGSRGHGPPPRAWHAAGPQAAPSEESR
jgi:AraC-like DNA-binding protein